MDHLWNEDGTPKRPGVDYTPVDTRAFLESAQRAAREKTPPDVGDVVHWYDERGACRAAIVMETEALSHNCELRVHIPHEPYADAYADHDEARSDNTWHWPCKGER